MRKKFLTVFVASMFALGNVVSAYSVGDVSITRLGGMDRYMTSHVVNDTVDSDTLIVVSGKDFADALVAAPLAYLTNGEVHLTGGKEVEIGIADAIASEKYSKAIIVGGTGVVSSDVEKYLKSKIKDVVRYGGKDRYETSSIVANAVNNLTKGKHPYAFLVNSLNYPDALSVSAVSAMTGSPIVLVGDNLSSSELKAIKEADKGVYKIGGVAVVGNHLDSKIGEYKRLGGIDRYETNKLVIDEFKDLSDDGNLVVASGMSFADALVGVSLSRGNKDLITLVDNTDIRSYTKETVESVSPSELFIVGETGVVSKNTADTLAGYSKFVKQGEEQVAPPIATPENPVAPEETTPSKPVTHVKSNKEIAAELNTKVLALINAERAKENLSALTEDKTLVDIAIEKSTDMGVNNYFDHVNLDGTYMYHKLSKKGYNFFGWAENIVMVGNFGTVDEIAKAMVDLWMNSEGHKKNILTANYNYSGVGVYITEDGKVYGTQQFVQK